MWQKLLIALLLLTVIITHVSATSYFNITDDILIDLDNGAYFTLLAGQNFTNTSEPVVNIYNSTDIPKSTLNINFNGTQVRWNNTVNTTLSGITYINNKLNFTTNTTAGTLNISAKTSYNTSLYKMYIDNTLSSSKYTNALGWVDFTSSTVSVQDFSIQLADWLASSNVTSQNSFIQAYPVTIYAEYNTNSNVTSSKVRVQNPDESVANYTMTCTGTSSASCSLVYTTTGNVGVYYIRFFYPIDWSGNERNITSDITFTTQPPLTGGSTGGESTSTGGGGAKPSTPTPTQTPNTTTTPPKLTFKDIREGATEPMAIDIAKCLTDSLTMNNECSSLNYGVVVEPFNWWVAIGAYISAIGIIFIQSIRSDKEREWFKETIIYGTFTIIISAILVSVGFNVYIINYLIDSPKYFYTFLNFGVFGAFITIVGDSYFYRNSKKVYKLKKKLSILETL